MQCLERKDGKQDSVGTVSESACKFCCIVLYYMVIDACCLSGECNLLRS